MPYRESGRDVQLGGGEPRNAELESAEQQETDQNDELKRVELDIRVSETPVQCMMWVRLPKEGVHGEEANQRLCRVGSHFLTKYGERITNLHLDDEARVLEVTTKPGDNFSRDDMIQAAKESEIQKPPTKVDEDRENTIAELTEEAYRTASEPAVA